MKILLIEDDEILVAQLTDYLISQNYLVESIEDDKLVLEYIQATNYDLVLLDLHLPGQDGISLCRKLRQVGYTGAILLQTVESESDYKVAGLDAGADDYIVKPFSLEELSARIRALLRRPQGMATPILQWAEIQLNPSTCEVSYRDQPVALSPKEYNLLELFMRNPHRIFNSSMLLERVWGFDETPGEETVRTHIKRLRQKLRRAGAEAVIENIYGMGYRLKAPEAQSPTAEAAESEDSASAARQFATSAISKFQDIIFARLATLAQAAAAPALSDELRVQAQQDAHKLAGALGMFGLPEGSDYSRQLETLLEANSERIDRRHLGHLVSQVHHILRQVLPTTPPFDPDQGAPVPDFPTPEMALPSQASRHNSQLLMVTTDHDWGQTLQQAAAPFLEVVSHSSLAQMSAHLPELSPEAILLDMTTLTPEATALADLSQYLESWPNMPVMVMTRTDSFEERLHISRYLTCTFLPRTLSLEQVVAIVQDTLQRRCLSTVRLLAVDDDPVILERLQAHLPRWGIHVTTLADPRLLWETLLDLNPDVLLLDVDMPHLDGIQLCQIIRSDRRWLGLPILFLTACREAETIQGIYAAGGDDYIPKPFTEPELVTRILNRLERSQQPRLTTLNALPSGLLGEHQARFALERDLMLAQHYRQPYCLGLITWDLEPSAQTSALSQSQFVLHNLVETLKSNLRRVDVLTQFQPETVTVGLYGVNQNAARKRFSHLLESLSQHYNGITVKFRYHLVAAPEDGTTLFALQQSLTEWLRHSGQSQ